MSTHQHQASRSSGPVFIPGDEVQALLTYEDLISAVERSLVTYSTQKSEFCQPLREKVFTRGTGLLATMPCYSAPDAALTCKMVTVFPDNRDAPSHQGIVALFHPDNGSLLAMMDAEELTCMRTAAASAVASRHLANPESRTLALIGSGEQAFSHFEAMATLFPIECIRVYSRSAGNRAALAGRIRSSTRYKAEAMKVQECNSSQEAVSEADIVCTVTASHDPVLESDWLPARCHVNAVGACRPSDRELHESVTSSAFLVVDSRESAASESGDVIINKATVHAELGEFVSDPNRFRELRASRGGLSVFKSLGLGIQDAAAAKLVWDRKKLQMKSQAV